MELVGRPWSRNTIDNILLPLIKNKAMSEKELINGIPGPKTGRLSSLNMAYQKLVRAGFPIRRKTFAHRGIRAGHRAGRSQSKHRVVIYYLE